MKPLSRPVPSRSLTSRSLLASAAALGLLGACASTGGVGPGAPPIGTEPMTNDDALVIFCAGSEGMLSDPRDAGLREALALLDDRLLELPDELDLDDVPTPMLELGRDILLSPMSLRVDLDGNQDPRAMIPIHAQLTVDGSPEQVSSIAQRVGGMLGVMLPMPQSAVEGKDGLKAVDTGFGSAYYGEDDGNFVVSYGSPKSADLGLGSLGLPKGVAPDFAVKLDVAQLRGPIEMGLAAAGDDAAPFRAQLDAMGLLGPDPVSFVVASGRGTDRRYVAARYTNYASVLERLGLLVREPLSARDLELVPQDATIAALGRSNLDAIVTTIEKMNRANGLETDVFAMLHSMVGIDVQKEIIAPLGATSGFYMSDSTGGGGLPSGVLFLSVDDEVTLEQTIEKLSDLASGLAQDAADGYVTVRRWEHGDDLCWSLSFPGLPIPLECSLGITDGYVLATLTPQALIAALDQANGGHGSLLDRPDFRIVVGDADDLASVNFQDTKRLIEDGYGCASFLFSALANGVRSRTTERGPNLVLPTYNDLLEDTRSAVMVSRIVGNDIVAYGESDPSFTANATALLGTPLPKIIGLAAAAAGFGAAQMRQESAQATQMQTQAQDALEQLEQLGYIGDMDDESDDAHEHDHSDDDGR